MRKRLSESPIGEKLTYSSDISLAECENFILESAVEENSFRQWLAHLVHFRFQILGEPNPYSVGDDPEEYEKLKALITKSLSNAGYETQSLETSMAKDENDLNKTIVSQ